jgi:exodeoxyribonuclease-5
MPDPQSTLPPLLSAEQNAALAAIDTFMDGGHGNVRRQDGPAGTGKTTVLRYVIEGRDDCAILDGNRFGDAHYLEACEVLDTRDRWPLLAPTNRAARQMSKATGVPASTIHRAIYATTEKLTPKGERLREALRSVIEQIKATDDAKALGELRLVAVGLRRALRRETIYERLARDLQDIVTGVLVDEASMVNAELLQALRQAVGMTTPILLIGDGFQLPPVEGEAVFEQVPLVAPSLTAVHRHGGRILDLCQHLRGGGIWHNWPAQPDDWDQGLHIGRTTGRVLPVADVVLAGTHFDRRNINVLLRNKLWDVDTISGGPAARVPRPGERLLVKSNDRESGLCNGDICRVEAILRDPKGVLVATLQLLDENNAPDGDPVTGIEIDEFGPLADYTSDLAAAPTPARRHGKVSLDYGYVLTLHSAQGAQWSRVLIWSRPVGPATRWRYTAASRARRRLIALY